MNTELKRKYIETIRLRLRTIANEIDTSFLRLEGAKNGKFNQFNNNVIYIIYLTLNNVAIMGDISIENILQNMLGNGELLNHAFDKIHKYEQFHYNGDLFLPATKFKNILTSQNVLHKLSTATIKKINVVIDYLVSELYQQSINFDTLTMGVIAKKDEEIGRWLTNIKFTEIKSTALESKALMDAI